MISGTYNNATRERFLARQRNARAGRWQHAPAASYKPSHGGYPTPRVSEHDPAHGLPVVDDPFLYVGALMYDANADTLTPIGDHQYAFAAEVEE